MAEYIERETAFDAITDLAGKAPTRSAYEAVWKSARALKKIPAADVVSVVRCKDCKYAYINSFSAASGVALCSSSAKVMQQDDFCSYGERKDGGAE